MESKQHPAFHDHSLQPHEDAASRRNFSSNRRNRIAAVSRRIGKGIIGNNPSDARRALDVVGEKSPYLASFLSECVGYGPRQHDAVFELKCTENEKLHNLADTGEIMIRDGATARNFDEHLEKSHYFAIDIHCCDAPLEGKDHVGFVSFSLRSKVFFLMPKLYPEMVKPVVDSLRRHPRVVFRHQWSSREAKFKEIFDWAPSEFIDVEDVARELKIPVTLDGLTGYLVGGSYCRRAANFGDTTIPSHEARRHRAIRVTLFYEFVVKARRLREKRDEERLRAGVSHVGGAKKRKVDREEMDLEQRRNRKETSRRDRDRDQDRDDRRRDGSRHEDRRRDRR